MRASGTIAYRESTMRCASSTSRSLQAGHWRRAGAFVDARDGRLRRVGYAEDETAAAHASRVESAGAAADATTRFTTTTTTRASLDASARVTAPGAASTVAPATLRASAATRGNDAGASRTSTPEAARNAARSCGDLSTRVRARSASSWQTASPLPAGASRTAASRAATSCASIASRLGGLSSSLLVFAPRRIAVARATLMAFLSASVRGVPVSISDVSSPAPRPCRVMNTSLGVRRVAPRHKLPARLPTWGPGNQNLFCKKRVPTSTSRHRGLSLLGRRRNTCTSSRKRPLSTYRDLCKKSPKK